MATDQKYSSLLKLKLRDIGLWLKGFPSRTFNGIKRLPRFLAGEIAGIGKEFLEMIRNFFRLRTVPGKRISLLLSLILFLICIKLYYNTSVERHAENPQDKLVPTGVQLWKGFKKTIFEVRIKEEYDENGEVIKNDLPQTLSEARSRDKQALADGKFSNRRDAWKNGSSREYLMQGESLLWQDPDSYGVCFRRHLYRFIHGCFPLCREVVVQIRTFL
jgi:hypothetical protein